MIDFVTIGKLQNPHTAALAVDYLERISRFAKCRHRPLRPSRLRDENRNGPAIMEEEGERILEALEGNAWCVLLDREGKAMDSRAFSRLLESRAAGPGKIDAAFVVGGFLGTAKAVRDRADVVLSISPMTLPHELAFLFLLEQVYRGLTIMNHVAYHK